MFSRRTEHDPTPNALARAALAHRAAGAPLFDLTVSNPTLAGIERDAEAITRALADPAALTYRPEPLGLPSARGAIAKDWAELGVSIDPARVVLTASTSEAYSFLLATLCDPHDEILVPAPGYPLLAQLAQLAGVHVTHYPLRLEQSRWVLDAAAIYDAIGERTRAIVVVSPNNPTGSWLDEDCAEALAALGLPLISDEVFARYPLEGDRARTSLLAAPRETLCFALGGLSKSAALPQMKLAWIGIDGPEHLVQPALERLELLGDAFLSVCTPVQVAAPALLASASRARDAIRARCARNLAALRARTRNTAIDVPEVCGGWYASLRVPATQADETWALALLEGDGVLVHPGYLFEFPVRQAWLVVSLLTAEPIFDAGIDALVARVARA